MRYALVLLFLVSTAFAEDSAKKFPVPLGPDLTAPYEIIDEVFGDQIKAAKDAGAKSDLAIKLLTTAATASNRFEKYALLEQAQTLALEANDLQLYFRTLDAIGETFQIDKVKQWSNTLVKLMDGQADEATLRLLAEADFSASDDPTKRSDAADAWYNFSKELKGPPAQISKERAILHYGAAMPGLQGLTKLRAQKRLQECQQHLSTTTRTTPPKAASHPRPARYGHGRIIEVDCTKGLNVLEAQKAQRNAAKAYGVPIEITNKIDMRFRFIPAGTFLMGSPEDELHRKKSEKQRVVKITEPFYMGMTEVTQLQYWKVTGQNPSKQKDKPNHPVEMISWNEANEFCLKLSKLDETRTYQLPTSAQHEYASRACVLGATYGPLDKIAWHARKSHAKTQPVALLAPNAWGLYDTMGNVWEWCQDEDSNHPGNRTSSGVSINFWPADHRLAIHSSGWPSSSFFDSGFRVCILLDEE